MRTYFTLPDHERQVKAARERGVHTLRVLMPCCHRPLEHTAPSEHGKEAWVGILMCPICGTVWNTTTTDTAVTFANPGLGVTARTDLNNQRREPLSRGARGVAEQEHGWFE